MMRSKAQAFSMVEMAVVLAIIGMIAGAGIGMGSSAVKGANRLATQEKLAAIKKALNLFARQNGYLPCPADRGLIPTTDASFGLENRSGTSCTAVASGRLVSTTNIYIGMVPVRTLGLPDSYANDSWNNKITYAVSSALIASPGSYNTTLTTGIVMRYGDLVTYQVALRSPVASASAPATGYAAFAVISHGPTGVGAFPVLGTAAIGTCGTTTVDSENCDDADNILYDGNYFNGNQSAQFFDDFVMWDTNLAAQTPLIAAPIGCSNITSATPYCEAWCAPCTINMPVAATAITNPILCSKVLYPSGSACQAICTWGGLITASSKYQPCP